MPRQIKYNQEIDGILSIKDEYAFPAADGSAGQVLTTDGAGAVTFQSTIFEEVSDVIREKNTSYDNDFIIGSPQLDDDGTAAHDSRMFFDKALSAFRAGNVDSTQWDNANIGQYSFATGYLNTASGYIATAIGWNNIASGSTTFAGGTSSTASSNDSFAFGIGTTASGSSSHAINASTIASGNNSSSYGKRSESYLDAMSAHASEMFTENGDSQNSKVQIMTESTNAAVNRLTIDGDTPALDNKLILPASRTWGFTIIVSARQTAGTAGTVGDSHIFEVKGGIKRDGANNTSMIGTASVSTIVTDAAAATWTVSVSADDTDESLNVDTIGEVNKTIHWSAKVELVEVG